MLVRRSERRKNHELGPQSAAPVAGEPVAVQTGFHLRSEIVGHWDIHHKEHLLGYTGRMNSDVNRTFRGQLDSSMDHLEFALPSTSVTYIDDRLLMGFHGIETQSDDYFADVVAGRRLFRLQPQSMHNDRPVGVCDRTPVTESGPGTVGRPTGPGGHFVCAGDCLWPHESEWLSYCLTSTHCQNSLYE